MYRYMQFSFFAIALLTVALAMTSCKIGDEDAVDDGGIFQDGTAENGDGSSGDENGGGDFGGGGTGDDGGGTGDGGSSGGSSAGNNTGLPDFYLGVWSDPSTQCLLLGDLDLDGDGDYFDFQFEITGDSQWIMTFGYFENASCSDPLSVSRLYASFIIAGAHSSGQGYNFDLTYGKTTEAAYNSDWTSYANLGGNCGYSDWENYIGIERDVSLTFCSMAAQGTVSYTAMYVDGANPVELFYGDASTGSGIYPETRPTGYFFAPIGVK